MLCVCVCVCVCFSLYFWLIWSLTGEHVAYFAALSCISSKGLSLFYSLPMCYTFPFLLTSISLGDLSKMLSVEKQVDVCHVSHRLRSVVCEREVWPECMSVTPDADSERSHSCLLYYRWSSLLFTAGQHDPQATGKCPGAPNGQSASAGHIICSENSPVFLLLLFTFLQMQILKTHYRN